MSSHTSMPREGNLEQLFCIFSYISEYHNTELFFDPSDPMADKSKYIKSDRTSSAFEYLQWKRQVHHNMLECRGLDFTIRAKVDADPVADTMTRRPMTTFLGYINSALVYQQLQLRVYYNIPYGGHPMTQPILMLIINQYFPTLPFLILL